MSEFLLKKATYHYFERLNAKEKESEQKFVLLRFYTLRIRTFVR